MGDSTSTLSAGTNALLRLGAAPVTRAADVLELFGIEPRSAAAASLGPAADTLLSTLSEAAVHQLVTGATELDRRRREKGRSTSPSLSRGAEIRTRDL
jgi:predicted Rossmann fold nucleotide-binding protein DprA/Smf involved in DNA uptake